MFNSILYFCIFIRRENCSFAGLRHVFVNSGDEAYQVMLYGQHNLKFAPTGLNSVSSRSHCIFTVKLLQHVECEHPKFVRISM
jgi:kinesin family protein 20